MFSVSLYHQTKSVQMQTLNNLPGKGLSSETVRGGFCTDTTDNPNPGFYIMEIWIDMPEYEGLYMVSNYGRVKSLPRTRVFYSCKYNREIVSNYKAIILKPGLFGGKYQNVKLSKNKVLKTRSIHRLVAMAFIPNPLNKPCINHKDGNPSNNHVSNLEWCTHKENSEHAVKNNLMNPSRGEDHVSAKLNNFQVRVIRKCDGLNQTELAKRMTEEGDKIDRTSISKILDNNKSEV